MPSATRICALNICKLTKNTQNTEGSSFLNSQQIYTLVGVQFSEIFKLLGNFHAYSVPISSKLLVIFCTILY